MFDKMHQIRAVASGVVWGGLAGIAVGILLAPASGTQTRQRLRARAQTVRDEAVQVAEETRARAEALQVSGRDMFEDNRRRIKRTVEAVQQSALAAWKADADDQLAEPASPPYGYSAVRS